MKRLGNFLASLLSSSKDSKDPLVEGLEHRTLLSATVTTVLLQDAFNGSSLNANLWRRPTWTSSFDGTFHDGTQEICTQTAPKASVSGGALHMKVYTYNPTQLAGYPSLWGDEFITKQSYSVTATKGVSFSVRARLTTPVAGGYLGGLFFYNTVPNASSNNEADIEILSKQVVSGTNKVNTNFYAGDPLGVGTPQFGTLPSGGKLTDWHTYNIVMMPTDIKWYIDGKLVRTQTGKVPTGTFNFRMNIWGPADGSWPAAYDAKLKPVTSSRQNRTFGMDIDSVTVSSIVQVFSATSATTNVNPGSVETNGTITAGGNVIGAGNGNVNYAWMAKRPDGTTVQVGSAMTATMTNGTAVIPDFTGLPTDTAGNHQVWFHITSPRVFNSTIRNYTVTVPFTMTDAAVDISSSFVDKGHTVTAFGAVTGTGSGTVNYVWMVQGSADTDPYQVGNALTANMVNGTAVIPDFTGLPTAVVDDYRAWIQITNAGDELTSTSLTYTVQEPVILTVTGATIQLGASSVPQGGTISGNGNVTSNADGNMTYNLLVTKPDGTTVQVNATTTFALNNGTAVLPDFTNLPTTSPGVYNVWVHIVSEGATLDSNVVSYTVTPVVPTIAITSVPALGSNGSASGTVSGVNITDYQVAVYLRVRGTLWTKPYWNNPATTINADGTWSANITTGGVDTTEGTEVLAYLVPKTTTIPLAPGDISSLNGLLFASATRS